METNSYNRIENEIWHLHVDIDDVTDEVVGARFNPLEILCAYYNVIYQIFSDYGIFAMFYTNRRIIFEYKGKNYF